MAEADSPRDIIHVDMDAFYAAVEMHDDPRLRGRPVIVGGIGNRGVVSTASYAARRFGVHSAQPIATARRLCPQGVFLPVRMSRYRAVSEQVFDVFSHYTPLVEPLSIDEAFLDVTGSKRLFGTALQIARDIKQRIAEATGLTASAGIGPSKFIAKIASDLQKPDGLTLVEPDRVTDFLDPLPITRMWGVGAVMRRKLQKLGIGTIGDLRRMPATVLTARFGRQGTHLHALASGHDPRPVVTARNAKSIGNEETFPEDILDRAALLRELLALSLQVGQRLRSSGCVGRTITLKVRYPDFVSVTRSVTSSEPTSDGQQIYRRCIELLKKTEAGRQPVRLLGIAVSQLTRGPRHRQLALLTSLDQDLRAERLNRAIDEVHRTHGADKLVAGTLLDHD